MQATIWNVSQGELRACRALTYGTGGVRWLWFVLIANELWDIAFLITAKRKMLVFYV